MADKRIVNIIHKWLKAGVLPADGRIEETEVATPQGGPVSVLTSNIYLHYALDLWYEKVVKPRLKGESFYVRYLDDFIVCFQYKAEAQAFGAALTRRLAKFALALEPSKTKLIQFGRFAQRDNNLRGKKTATLSFLGLTFYSSTCRNGRFRVGIRTGKSRLKRGSIRLRTMMKIGRHRTLREQIMAINTFLGGHYNYYGIAGNFAGIVRMYRIAFKSWRQVLSTRSQSGSVTFRKYDTIITKYPILKPKLSLPSGTRPKGLSPISV